MSERLVELCKLDDLQEGQARGFSAPGFEKKVIVVRKNGKIFGYLDSCPHYPEGTPMAWKKDAYMNGDGSYLACHSHGALFDIETGGCIIGPCMGQSLTRVDVEVVGEKVLLNGVESAVGGA